MSLSRSGRTIVYANEVPYETDVLYTNLYKMVDVSKLAQAVLGGTGTGNATLVSGLIAVPHSPANLTIDIGAGVIYTLAALDATAYSTIPADTSDFLYKPYTQVSSAFNQAGFTPPGSGTLNYLVQARGLTTDTDPASRPFFNPANPANPIFQTVNQTRLDGIEYLLTSAVSPAIPTPTPGYVGLYVVSVAAGQTTITSGNITVYSAAPFITESLTEKIGISTGDARYVRPFQLQNEQYTYAVTTGSANAYVASFTPAVASLVAGLAVKVVANFTNTGPATLNINGLGAIAIKVIGPAGLANLVSGEIVSGCAYDLVYNGTSLQLMNPSNETPLLARVHFNPGGAGQTLASNTITQLNFDATTYDPYAMWNSGTFRFTAPVTGKYAVAGSIVVQNGETNKNLSLLAYVNSAPISLFGYNDFFTNGATTGSSGGDILQVTAGQTVDLRAQNRSTTSPLTIVLAGSFVVEQQNFFTIEYLGN